MSKETIEKKGLEERIEKLVVFLSDVSNENFDMKVSAGDVMGYICGYFDLTSEPNDEIETFD